MAKIVGYYDVPGVAGFGEDTAYRAVRPPSYFNTPLHPFYPDWQHEPVPGWGVRPEMAGPRMVGVGDAAALPAVEVKPEDHPAIRALKEEALAKYPGDPAKQTAHILTKGPGLARSLDQWLASPDSEAYRNAHKIFGLPRTVVFVGAIVGVAALGYVLFGRKSE